MKLLIVVDMQNDFIDGALGTAEAQAIVPYVKERINSFDGKVIFTRDTHFEDYLETAEGKNSLSRIASRGRAAGRYARSFAPMATVLPLISAPLAHASFASFWQRRCPRASPYSGFARTSA